MFDKLFKKNNPIKYKKTGSHGDHWSAIFGFETFENNKQLAIDEINETIATGGKEPLPNGGTRISSEAIRPGFVVQLNKEGTVDVAFPVLETLEVTPFEIKEILEWEHVQNTEAQIAGGGEKRFALTFYATDYLINREKYRTQKQLNVNLSGLGYVIKSAKEMPENFSEKFSGYMPSEHGDDIFDFVGPILKIKIKKTKEGDVKGYILQIGLVQDMDGTGYSFAPEIYFNAENMRLETMEKGDKVTGAFWLHGCLAL